jgi:hypothetical protein
MLPGKNRQVEPSKDAIKPVPATRKVDNTVLSIVQYEYSLMDQQHARIRNASLAAHDSEQPEQAKAATELS